MRVKFLEYCSFQIVVVSRDNFCILKHPPRSICSWQHYIARIGWESLPIHGPIVQMTTMAHSALPEIHGLQLCSTRMIRRRHTLCCDPKHLVALCHKRRSNLAAVPCGSCSIVQSQTWTCTLVRSDCRLLLCKTAAQISKLYDHAYMTIYAF